MARHGRRVELGTDARAAIDGGAAVVERLVAPGRAGLRRLDGLRRPRQHRDPGGALGRAADGARALARRRDGRRDRAGGRAGHDPAACPQPGDGLLGGTGRGRGDDARTAQRRRDASGARARLARGEWRPRALGVGGPRAARRGRGPATRRCPRRRGDRAGRGRRGTARAAGQRGLGADQRHRWDARHGRAGPGRSRRVAARRRHRRGDVDRGPPRHGPGVRRGSHRHASPGRAGGERRQPANPPGRFGDRGQPSPWRRPSAGRLLPALHTAGPRGGARHDRARPCRRRS